jgi:putative addiction module antidote
VSIQERKIRKSGNSVVLTLSKELLEKIGIQENDYVFVDEDKLAAAITKKSLPSEQELEINRLIDQSFSQYEEMYKELANH